MPQWIGVALTPGKGKSPKQIKPKPERAENQQAAPSLPPPNMQPWVNSGFHASTMLKQIQRKKELDLSSVANHFISTHHMTSFAALEIPATVAVLKWLSNPHTHQSQFSHFSPQVGSPKQEVSNL